MKRRLLKIVLAFSVIGMFLIAIRQNRACIIGNPPTALFQVNTPPAEQKNGTPIEFDGSESHDNDETDIITWYLWDWENDGTYDDATESATIEHTFATVGPHTVKLKVHDDDMGWDTEYHSFTWKKVHYVDTDADSDGGGTTWVDAYDTLQEALSAAIYSDEIWVADGTYKPGTLESDSFDLDGSSNKIYGGFAGVGVNEPNIYDRDWATNKTILSGEIGTGAHTDNCYHVVKGADDALLDGFIITRGYADGTTAADKRGGGLHTNGAYEFQAKHCVFIDNYAQTAGGGMYSNGSFGSQATLLRDCFFIDNKASSGGGLAIDGYVIPYIRNCVLSENEAGTGGAIDGNEGCAFTMNHCTVYNNSASDKGGGIATGAKGFDYTSLNSCVFWGNCATNGDPDIYSKITPGNAICIRSSLIEDCSGWCDDDTGSCDDICNEDTRPWFVDTNDLDGTDNKWFTKDDGLAIRSTSPCVDQGGGRVPDGSQDIVGRSYYDADANDNTCYSDYTDMGAYEWDTDQ